MNKEQRELYGVTDQDWSDARHRVREAIVGGRAQYQSRRDRLGYNGKQGTIRKVVKSTREIELAFDDGTRFRAFAHNITFC